MEEPPAWRGINLHTAETLRFAATSQLLQTYLECLRFPVSPAIVHAWLLHSHQGQTSPDGMPHGLGSAQLLGGLTYHGSFKGGLLHGQGTLTKDGVSYSGGFSYNCIHGSGTYRWEKGASYNGQVYQGLPHGDGLMYTGDEDCCTYEGAWKHGLRHGQGKLIYGKDGTTKYEGRWVHDRKHGEGSQIYGSGSTYQGSWLEGKKDGRGRLVALSSPEPSLSSYQAGLGRLALARVYIYEGDWINDLPSGSGKSVWMSDEKEECSNHLLNSYIGEFERGLRHGQGCFFYASGSFYKGGWNENKKNGNGLYIYENGKVLCGTFVCDHFVLQEEACPVVKEPLHSLLEGEENMEVIKDKVTNVLLRHNSALKEIFSIYSSMIKGEREAQLCTSITPCAIMLEQLWQLCHDGNIVQNGLGLAQIDFLLHSTETSWDRSSEMHKSNRCFIFREFVESMIRISKVKFSAEDCSLDFKIDKLVTKHIIPLLTVDSEACSDAFLIVDSMKSVFDGYAPQLKVLFNETLCGIGTSDETIKLRVLDIFLQRYKPQWGSQRDLLLSNLVKGLYRSEIDPGDDGTGYLDNDINYTEFQFAVYIYATTLKDQAALAEPILMLNDLIKNAIVPNLSVSLESLLNEDLMPTLPNINTKGKNGSSTSKTPRSVPGSKRSTPREGKVPQGAKSAPQTPIRKKR